MIAEQELTKLRARWAPASLREKARIEDYVWRNSGVPKTQAKPIVAQIFGCSQYDVSQRRNLFWSGDAVNPIWDRLETGNLPLGTAVHLLRVAKAKYSKALLHRGVIEALAEYDKIPGRGAQPLSPPEPESPDQIDDLTLNQKAFWRDIRSRVGAYFTQRAGNAPADEVEAVAADFTRDLEAMFATYTHRVYRLGLANKPLDIVSKGELRSACTTLHIDPPTKNQPIDDFFAAARKQQRQLARLYHPDRNAGSNATRPQYDAVIKAFAVIEHYVELRKRQQPESQPPPHLRVVRGSKP